MTALALRAVADHHDIYVATPAATPRCVLADGRVEQYGREELEPIDWTTVLPEKPAKSSVRRRGEMDLEGW